MRVNSGLPAEEETLSWVYLASNDAPESTREPGTELPHEGFWGTFPPPLLTGKASVLPLCGHPHFSVSVIRGESDKLGELDGSGAMGGPIPQRGLALAVLSLTVAEL